jgi:DNA-binding MarR family transcriptional regulator
MGPREYTALADFRYELRRFLRFSEQAARDAGTTLLRYQLLLQLRGDPRGYALVGTLAERLQLVPHGVVSLISRCEGAGLVRRTADDGDARRVRVRLTARGKALVERLARLHRDELRHQAKALALLLKR